MLTVDLAQKVTLFLFLSVGNCVDPNFVSVMICYLKSTGMNVKGYSLVLIVYNNDKS